MKKLCVLLLVVLLCGCANFGGGGDNPVERQLDRSLLLDGGISLGLDNLPIPIPLPDFRFGFHLHWRRPTLPEEIELNLSKKGKVAPAKPAVPAPSAPPAPFAGRSITDD